MAYRHRRHPVRMRREFMSGIVYSQRVLQQPMGFRRRYLLPLSLGFAGMFLCHVLILLGFMNGIRYPIYCAAYPLVYCVTAALLSLRSGRHLLTDVLLLNAVPCLYWYLLLWSDGKLHLDAALDWQASSGMLVIMPLTIGLSLAVSFLISRRKRKNVVEPDSAGA